MVMDATRRTGSSPRLRGTRVHRRGARRRVRFIPAPAGNATLPRRQWRTSSVHPRACGERRGSMRPSSSSGGSSPRLRGTRTVTIAGASRSRFIPAPAGNAPDWSKRRDAQPVHPRACGERRSCSILTLTSPGSSPRLRGTRAKEQKARLPSRFIPAPAGNARFHAAEPFRWAVHPRACGERALSNVIKYSDRGSSPRLRGTQGFGRRCAGGDRFIPAPAGNALGFVKQYTYKAVHPRACGERPLYQLRRYGRIGSSPRLRGTHTM